MISEVRREKTFAMLSPSLALVSTNQSPYWWARCAPCLVGILRSCSRSLLEPTRIMFVSELPTSLICSIHDSMWLKLLGSVIEYVSTIPWAPLQKLLVMLRNLSCPAVSQMLSVTWQPSNSMRLILKSTPMVLRQSDWKVSSQYLTSRLVLPTPLSPTTRYFKVIFFWFIIQLQPFPSNPAPLPGPTPPSTVCPSRGRRNQGKGQLGEREYQANMGEREQNNLGRNHATFKFFRSWGR